MSRLDHQAGREHALEVLRSVIGCPKAFFEGDAMTTLTANLEATCASRPAAFAAGVMEIVALVRRGGK